MEKFKSAYLYQFLTKFKSLSICCVAEWTIYILIILIVQIFDKNPSITVSIESSSAVYIGIFGSLGYKADFKALIQNGFTRKYIYCSTAFSLISLCAILSVLDTLADKIASAIVPFEFNAFAGNQIYGNTNIVKTWLLAFSLYFLTSSLLFMITLLANKIGVRRTLYIGAGIAILVVGIVALVKNLASDRVYASIGEFLLKLFGFLPNGELNSLYTTLTLAVAGVTAYIISFLLIRKTEIK